MPETSRRNCWESPAETARVSGKEECPQEKEQITKITSSKLGKGLQISRRNWGTWDNGLRFPIYSTLLITWISFHSWMFDLFFFFYGSLHALGLTIVPSVGNGFPSCCFQGQDIFTLVLLCSSLPLSIIELREFRSLIDKGSWRTLEANMLRIWGRRTNPTSRARFSVSSNGTGWFTNMVYITICIYFMHIKFNNVNL